MSRSIQLDNDSGGELELARLVAGVRSGVEWQAAGGRPVESMTARRTDRGSGASVSPRRIFLTCRSESLRLALHLRSSDGPVRNRLIRLR